MGVSKQNSKLNGGLGVTEGLAEGRAAGEIQNKKVMERHSGCGGHTQGRSMPGYSPSCAIWPAVSHLGWSVCRLVSCSGTETRGWV